MRGYFDDEEVEPAQETRDTELTLSAGALLAIFFGLVLICGLCFGLGYEVGHRTSGPSSAAAAPPPTQTAAPDQEPLLGNGSIPKPAAAAQVAAPPAAPTGANPADGAAQQGPSPGPGMAQSAPPPGTPAGSPQSQPEVHAAMPSIPNSAQPMAGAAPNVHAALPSASQLMVQVAAVSHTEDAAVLVEALRKHGYAATEQRDPGDGLIHVRIGPFSNRDDANRWRTKLLDDGYNAIVQP